MSDRGRVENRSQRPSTDDLPRTCRPKTEVRGPRDLGGVVSRNDDVTQCVKHRSHGGRVRSVGYLQTTY